LNNDFNFDELFPKEIILTNKQQKINLSKNKINKIYKDYINENHNEEVIRYKKDIAKKVFKKPINLKGHTDKVTSIAISMDNLFLVSGGYGGNIKVWNLKTFSIVKDIQIGNKKTIWSVDISYGNKYIASGSSDNTIRICGLKDENICYSLKGHDNDITSVTFTRNGKYLVSGSVDRSIKIWDFRNERLIKTLKGHDSTVRDISLSADDKYIVSGGYDNKVKIWDFQKAQLVDTFKGHTKSITSVEVSSDDVYIISSSEDDSIIIWDFINKKIFKTITISSTNEIQGHYSNPSVISADDIYIILARGNIISIWDLDKTKLVKEFGGHKSQVNSLLISSDNKYIISSSDDNTIQVGEFSHITSPYQKINYKLFALMDYFTKKYKLSENMPLLDINDKDEFEKQSDYEKRVKLEKNDHDEQLKEFNDNNTKDIQQYAKNIISTVYGIPSIMGEIKYNAEDEFFLIKVKFGNIKTVYNISVDVPIDIAPSFKKDINSVHIQTKFRKDDKSMKISQIFFIYKEEEYKARN
jgi:WD40 repeat protein